MTFARIEDGLITLEEPPESLRLPDGRLVCGLNHANAETLAGYGWHPCVEVFAELTENQAHGEPTLEFDAKAGEVTARYAALDVEPPPPTDVEKMVAAIYDVMPPDVQAKLDEVVNVDQVREQLDAAAVDAVEPAKR